MVGDSENKHVPMFSIIMPVYNTPNEYLEKMVECIKIQAFADFELIIIDDGSDEACYCFLEKLAESDNRINLCHQENKGVSAARNRGISLSCGKYILFVDSDDLISNNYLEEAFLLLQEFSPDVVFGGLEYVPKQCVKQALNKPVCLGKEEKKELLKCLLNVCPRKYDFRILGSVSAKIYKNEIIKSTLFDENVKFFEDQLYIRRIIDLSDSILVVPNIWYYYLQNEFSAMHKKLKRDYFENVKPSWDKFAEHNDKADETLLIALSIGSLKMFYWFIGNENMKQARKWSQKRRIIKVAACHKMVNKSVDFLYKNKRNKDIELKQLIGVFCLKYRLYLLLYILCQIRNK